MRTLPHCITGIVITISLFLSACNDAAKDSSNAGIDSTNMATKDTTTEPVYDPAKDIMTTGAAFTKKLADTLGIRIVELTLKPGDSLPFHSDPDHAFYLVDSSKSLFYIPGKTNADTLSGPAWSPGLSFIMSPFTEAFKNIGKTPLRWVKIYVHRTRALEVPAPPAYDSATDAYILGGESIQKLGDTLGIKLFTVTINPGDTATMHSHPDHAVYVIQGGELAVSFKGGPRVIMKMDKGMAFVGGPLSDAAKNTGKTSIKLLIAHIYRQRTT